MSKRTLKRGVIKNKCNVAFYEEHVYKVMFPTKHGTKKDVVEEKKYQEKKMKKSTWIFLLCNVLIIGAIIAYTFMTQEVKPLSELFAEKPYYRFFSLALVVVGLIYISEAICYSILLKKTTGKFNFWLGLRVAIVGKYWDNITPFGSGGQVAQIAYIKGKGNSGDVATSVIIGKYLNHQIGFIILGILAILAPFDMFGMSGLAVKYLATFGIIINAVIFGIIMLVSTSKKACSFFVVGGLKLLTKLRIIKNYRAALTKSMRFIKEYQMSMKAFMKRPLIVIAEVLLNIMYWVLLSMVAWLVYLMFHPTGGVNGLMIMTMSFLCSFASSVVPIPGGSGAAEISFMVMFGALFTTGTTFWALMLWRVLTYYIFLLVGFAFTIAEPFFIRHRNNKLLKLENSSEKAVVEENE